MINNEADRRQRRWWSAAEIAREIGVTTPTVWRWAASGRIPAGRRLGRRCTRWNRNEVLSCLGLLDSPSPAAGGEEERK